MLFCEVLKVMNSEYEASWHGGAHMFISYTEPGCCYVVAAHPHTETRIMSYIVPHASVTNHIICNTTPQSEPAPPHAVSHIENMVTDLKKLIKVPHSGSPTMSGRYGCSEWGVAIVAADTILRMILLKPALCCRSKLKMLIISAREFNMKMLVFLNRMRNKNQCH